MVKVEQTQKFDNVYWYKFTHRGQTGELEYNAVTSEITLVRPIDAPDSNRAYMMARTALMRDIKTGVIPKTSLFASH